MAATVPASTPTRASRPFRRRPATLATLAVLLGAAATSPASGQAPPAPRSTSNAATSPAVDFTPPPPGSPGSAARPLKVSVADRPPFAFKNALGDWQGFTVELWTRVAERLEIAYEFKEESLEDLLDAIDEGRIEVSALGVAITPERARANHLTHAFETSAIAVATTERVGWLPSITASFSGFELLQLLLLLFVLFLVAAILLWLVERRVPDGHFDRRLGHGVAAGLWWAAVTFSTVGYGDKVPRTTAGRAVGVAWMLISVVAVSLFTGVVASRITLTAGATAVSDVASLAAARVGVVEGSLAEDVLKSIGVPSIQVRDDRDGIERVASRSLDAYVSERAVLHHLIGPRPDRGLRLLPQSLARDYLAFPFDRNLPRPLLEAIDIAMLEELEDPDWRWVRQRFLGELLGAAESPMPSAGLGPGGPL